MVERVAAAVLGRLGTRGGSRRGGWPPWWETLAVITTCAGLDLLLWEQARQGRFPWPLALAVQICLAALLGLWLWSRLRRGLISTADSLFSAFIAFLGPLGVVGVLSTALFLQLYRRRATTFEEWYADLFPDAPADLSSDIAQQISSRRERSSGSSDVRPFVDVLSHGRDEQKQAVIALLARKFDPALAAVLDMAQIDDDPSIRVLAASATAAIERRFLDRWLDLNARVEAAPLDERVLFALAAHLDGYAFSGILSEQRVVDIRTQALRCHLKCLRLNPGSRRVRIAMGRLLLRSGKTIEACEIFGDLLAEPDEADAAATVTIRCFHAECLYRLGRYRDLRTALRYFADAGDGDEQILPVSLRDIVSFWRDNDIPGEVTKVG